MSSAAEHLPIRFRSFLAMSAAWLASGYFVGQYLARLPFGYVAACVPLFVIPIALSGVYTSAVGQVLDVLGWPIGVLVPFTSLHMRCVTNQGAILRVSHNLKTYLAILVLLIGLGMIVGAWWMSLPVVESASQIQARIEASAATSN